MTRIEKKRLEELFNAELILRRVYLHLQQAEHANMAASMLVVNRFDEITDEAEKLRRAVKRGKK